MSNPTPQPKKQEDTGELREKIANIDRTYMITDNHLKEFLLPNFYLDRLVEFVNDHTAKAVAEAEDRVHREVCPACKAINTSLKAGDA